MNSTILVQKLWNYCNVLRHDGMSYGDYVEQLTYLLFDSRPPFALYRGPVACVRPVCVTIWFSGEISRKQN